MLLLGILTLPLPTLMILLVPKMTKMEVLSSYVDLQTPATLTVSLQIYQHRNHQELELDPTGPENASPLHYLVTNLH